MEYSQIYQAAKDAENPIAVVQRVSGWPEGMAAMQWHRMLKMFEPEQEQEQPQEKRGYNRYNPVMPWHEELLLDPKVSNQTVCDRTGLTASTVSKWRKQHGIKAVRHHWAKPKETVVERPPVVNATLKPIAYRGLVAEELKMGVDALSVGLGGYYIVIPWNDLHDFINDLKGMEGMHHES